MKCSENLLTVDIYWKDLSVRVMAQELTYSGWSLLCDLGGSLGGRNVKGPCSCVHCAGLFMGASIIGLVELIWLCMFERVVQDL